jgi:hypothetical protein
MPSNGSSRASIGVFHDAPHRLLAQLLTLCGEHVSKDGANIRVRSLMNSNLHAAPHSEKGGMGVFAHAPISAGEKLVIWGGVIVTAEQLRQLPNINQIHSIQVEEDLYLASEIPDDNADYINHSCDPNAGLQGEIVLVARRNIESGEEICFDYAMSDGSLYDEFVCKCRTMYCRGHVTCNDWIRSDLQARYGGYFSPYLQRRMDQLLQQVANQ